MISLSSQMALILSQIFNIEYIIKKHGTFTAISIIHVCIKRSNNRLVFKIKEGYNLQLQTPKTIKLFGSTKTLIDETGNREKNTKFWSIEVLLVQYNLVENQYQ